MNLSPYPQPADVLYLTRNTVRVLPGLKAGVDVVVVYSAEFQGNDRPDKLMAYGATPDMAAASLYNLLCDLYDDQEEKEDGDDP